MSWVIASLVFTDEGVLVTYMDPIGDVRNRGLLVRSMQMHIATGDGGKDYGEEIEDLKDAAGRLLVDALEDFQSTPPASQEELAD
jgi:hypothetical protein